MAYNPGNQNMMGQYLIDQAEQKRQRKENDALVKGFMQMHQASPELQKLIPVDDWGDVAPNQIKGWVQGVALQQQQQQQQQAQQQAMQAQQQQQAAAEQAAQRQALERAALEQVLAGIGGDSMTPSARFLQAGGGQQLAPKDLIGILDSLSGPRGYDLTNDGNKDVWLAPTGNQLNLGGERADKGEARKALQGLLTSPIGGNMFQSTVRLGDYIDNTYNPDGTTKEGRKQNTAAEELLRQANELSIQVSGQPLFLPKAKRTAAAPAAGAPAAPAAVAPAVDPLVQQAQAYIQQLQQGGGGPRSFATMEEAEAAMAEGYRGPAMVAGRRVVIE